MLTTPCPYAVRVPDVRNRACQSCRIEPCVYPLEAEDHRPETVRQRHAQVMELKGQGKSIMDIARVTCYSIDGVKNVLRRK